MATKNNIKNINSESIKMARSIALSLAALSIALAALCLALLSFNSNQNQLNNPTFNKVVQVSLMVLGTVLILTSALSIDWVIDQFRDDDWRAVLENNANPQKYDQFPARLSLFNSGYFILCICIAGLSFMILLQGLYKFASPNTTLFNISFIFSILWSLYIVFQMMTHKFGRIIFALIAFGVVIGLVLLTILS